MTEAVNMLKYSTLDGFCTSSYLLTIGKDIRGCKKHLQLYKCLYFTKMSVFYIN